MVRDITKGITAIIYQVALLRIENASLYKANEALSKRRRAKRIRVQLRGLLTLQDAIDLLGPGAIGREGVQETQLDSSSTGGVRTRVRYCSMCGKPGYNARTYQEATEVSDLAISDVIIVGS